MIMNSQFKIYIDGCDANNKKNIAGLNVSKIRLNK